MFSLFFLQNQRTGGSNKFFPGGKADTSERGEVVGKKGRR
jgi:hypothetical protein